MAHQFGQKAARVVFRQFLVRNGKTIKYQASNFAFNLYASVADLYVNGTVPYLPYLPNYPSCT